MKTPLQLDWVTFSSPTIDPTTGAKLGTATPQTEAIKCIFHPTNIAKTRERMFTEIEDGDVLIDIPDETTIEGREQLSFTVNGRKYVQKDTSGKSYAEHYEVVDGIKICRTLLLSLMH